MEIIRYSWLFAAWLFASVKTFIDRSTVCMYQYMVYYLLYIQNWISTNQGPTYSIPMETNNLWRGLGLIYTKSVRSISYELFITRVKFFSQKILSSIMNTHLWGTNGAPANGVFIPRKLPIISNLFLF